MAKKRKNQKRKHSNDNENKSDFMADLPESTEQGEWSPNMDVQSSPSEISNSETNESLQNQDLDSSVKKEHHENKNDEPVHQEFVERASELSDDSNEEPSDHQEVDENIHNDLTVGAFLRTQRESLGIQLKNVVQSTKISLTNLEHLESDNLDALPDKAYVTGYVKSYSKLLNLNSAEALKLLDSTYVKLGKTQAPQEIVIPQAQNAPSVSTPLPIAKIAAGIIGALLVIAIATFVWFKVTSTDDQQESPVKEEVKTTEQSNEITPQSLSAETPLQDEIPEGTPVGAQTEKQPKEQPEEQRQDQESEVLPVKTQAKKEEPKQVVKKEESKEVAVQDKKQETKEEVKKEESEESAKEYKFYQMASTLYQYDTEMSEERQEELIPARFRVATTNDSHAVFITAFDGDSWITYKSDDEDTRKFVLKEGRSILIRGKLTRVFLGNLGAVKIFYNNRPLKVNSPSGVKSLVFPQEESRNYVTPLFIYKKDGTVITSEEYLEENPQ